MMQLYARNSSIDPTKKNFSGMSKTLVFTNDVEKSMTILLYLSVKCLLFVRDFFLKQNSSAFFLNMYEYYCNNLN